MKKKFYKPIKVLLKNEEVFPRSAVEDDRGILWMIVNKLVWRKTHKQSWKQLNRPMHTEEAWRPGRIVRRSVPLSTASEFIGFDGIASRGYFHGKYCGEHVTVKMSGQPGEFVIAWSGAEVTVPAHLTAEKIAKLLQYLESTPTLAFIEN